MHHTDSTWYIFSAGLSRAILTGGDSVIAAPSIRGGALRFNPVFSWCFWLPTTDTKNWISCQQTTNFIVITRFPLKFKLHCAQGAKTSTKASNLNQKYLHSDLDISQIAPKMLWIHYVLSASVILPIVMKIGRRLYDKC